MIHQILIEKIGESSESLRIGLVWVTEYRSEVASTLSLPAVGGPQADPRSYGAKGPGGEHTGIAGVARGAGERWDR